MKNKWPLIIVVLIACVSMASYLLQFNPQVKSFLYGENPACVERGAIDTIVSFSRNRDYNNPLEKIKLVQEIRNCPTFKFGPNDHFLLNSYELKVILFNNLTEGITASRQALEQAVKLNAPHIDHWNLYWQIEEMLQMAKGPENINELCETISKINNDTPDSIFNLSRLMKLAVLRCHLIEGRYEEGLSLSRLLESQVILEQGQPKSKIESQLMFFLKMTRSYLLLASGQLAEAGKTARETWKTARSQLRWSLIFPSAQVHHAFFLLISGSGEIETLVQEMDKNSRWLEGEPLKMIEFWKTFIVATKDALKGNRENLQENLSLMKQMAKNLWSGNQQERTFLTISVLEAVESGNDIQPVLLEYRSQWGTNYLYLLLKNLSNKLTAPGAD